jgi:hypothetical protein
MVMLIFVQSMQVLSVYLSPRTIYHLSFIECSELVYKLLRYFIIYITLREPMSPPCLISILKF